MHLQVFEEDAAVGMGVIPHAPMSLGRKLGNGRIQSSVFVKKFLGLVALHPLFKQLDMILLLCHLGQGHLV